MKWESSRGPTRLAPERLFDTLPLAQRLFVRARLLSAPLRELALRAPPGKIADVGCGHGLVSALLAAERPDRSVLAIDPDPRKIEWARRALAPLEHVTVERARIEDLLPSREGTLDGVVVADVLYLLPVEAWAGFLCDARRLLRAGGTLLLKEAEADGSWKYWKCLAQEELMVKLLRKTQSSGGLKFKPRAFTEKLLASAGFRLYETVNLSRGYATPHVLFLARAS